MTPRTLFLISIQCLTLATLLTLTAGFQWIKPFPSAIPSLHQLSNMRLHALPKKKTSFVRTNGGFYKPLLSPEEPWKVRHRAKKFGPDAPRPMPNIRLPARLTRPRIKRPVAGPDKVPLESLYVGQRLRGRVINVLDYGMFVDVGTSKDGLVHIRDIDNQHFVHRVDVRFRPGDDITVYVKFVVPEEKKFGLQLQPVDALLQMQAASFRNQTKLMLEDLRPEQQLAGQVVRSSNYGVYVDIGVEGIHAFLHRRKMKSNRKMRHYTPVEVCPMGSMQTCYVHEIEPALKRVSISTYPPEEWATRIVPPRGLRAVIDPETEIYKYGYDGGELPTAKDKYKRMLQMERIFNKRRRELGLDRDEYTGRGGGMGGMDDDDDADLDGEGGSLSSDEVDKYGETLSAEEIRRLSPEYAQLVLDDTAPDTEPDIPETDNPNINTNSKYKSKDCYTHYFNTLPRATTEAVFDSVRHTARPYIIFSDLKRWRYIKLMCFVNKLTLPDLQQLFIDSGAVAGRMNVQQFARFRALLDLFLDLKPDPGDYSDLNVDVDNIKDSDFTHEFAGLDEYNYGKDEAEEEVFDLGEYAEPEVYQGSVRDGTSNASSASGGGNGKSGTSSSTSGTSGSNITVSGRFGKLLTRRLTASTKSSAGTDVSTEAGGAATSTSGVSSTDNDVETSASTVDGTGSIVGAADSAVDSTMGGVCTSGSESVDMVASGSDHAAPEVVVPAKRGRKKKVATTTVVGTDITRADSVANTAAIVVAPIARTTTNTGVADPTGTVVPKKRGRKPKATAITDASGDADTAVTPVDVGTVDSVGDTAEAGGAESIDPADYTPIDEIDVPDNTDVKGLSDAELNQQVFESIANNKAHITIKDLLGWDLVHMMLAEGTLTNDSLQELFSRYQALCGSRKGVDVTVFEPLVDELARIYGASRAAQEGLVHGEGPPSAEKKDVVRDAVNSGAGGCEVEDEEVVELDTVAEFARMSQGREHITLQDLKQWWFFADGVSPLPESAWTQVLAECGISNADAITAPQFEEVVDAVLARYEVV